jgi:hypothetical protein
MTFFCVSLSVVPCNWQSKHIMLQHNQVLSFFRPRGSLGDWSQQELAEFYRVEAALVNSGVAITTDRGITDEGDPWLVFCRDDNDEVIVHFARIDGEYVVASNLAEAVVRGRNFNNLIRELLDSHPYVIPKAGSRRQTVYLHPATLLAALIVTGYIKSTELNGASDEAGRTAEKSSDWFFSRHDLVAYSAIVIAAVWDQLTADYHDHKFNVLAWFDDAKADPDAADSSTPSHSPYDGAPLSDLAFKGPQDHVLKQDHVLNAAHLDAAFAQSFEQLTADAVTHGNDGWAANLIAQIKALGYQSFTTHSNDGDLYAGSHDATRAGSETDGKSLVWHPETSLTELAANSSAAGFVVAASKLDSPPPDLVASGGTGSHGSSTSPVVQSLNSNSPDASTAWSVVSDALHMDPQILHPVVLAATNLIDAVQSTMQLLNQESGSTAASANPLSTPLPAIGNTASSPANSVFSTPVNPFDAIAKVDLQEFFQSTPNYKIESFGHDLLVVDMNASHFASNTLETWTMADGSTLSILGQAPHASAHLAA